jgi:hypothetical protein
MLRFVGDLAWRDSRAWLAACGAVVLVAAVVLVRAVRMHLPPVPCTVPTPAQALALAQAGDRVDRLAHWVEALSALSMGGAVGGLLVARGSGRRWLILCLFVAAGVAFGAAGYAADVSQRGCGI